MSCRRNHSTNIGPAKRKSMHRDVMERAERCCRVAVGTLRYHGPEATTDLDNTLRHDALHASLPEVTLR